MKHNRCNKLSIEGDSLNNQLRIISYLLFFLPFTVVSYIFFQEGVLQRQDSGRLLILLLVLLLALSGKSILRNVFRKFAMVSVFMKKAETGEKVMMEELKCSAELLEISRAFNNLVSKHEETDRQLKKLNLELTMAHVDCHRAEEALIPLRKVVDIMQLGVTISDPLRKILYTNLADARMHGYEVNELIDRDVRLFAPGSLQKELTAEDFIAMKSWARESSNIRKDGSLFPVRITSDVVLDTKGECLAIVSTCEDITERKQTEQAILDRLRLQDKLAKISATVPGMIFTFRLQTDGVMSIPYASPTMDLIFGLEPEAVIEDASPAFSLFHPHDIDLVRETIATSARTMNPWQNEFRVRHPRKGEIWVEGHAMPQQEPDGSIIWHGFMHDVTERKCYELELKHQAGHDMLTGLANRNLMADRLLQNTIHARRSRQNIGIMLLDLDRFKMVNDSMGHNYGDELLQQVAERLVDCVRAGDTVCRMGGDEFVIILSELVEEDSIGLLAKRIHETLAEPFALSDHQLRITVSIGISLFPKDGELVETLIRNADIAMYRAKEEGGDKFRFFAPEMNVRIQGILELEEEMHQAIQQGEFIMHYQPQIEIASGRIVGCEALLRWRHPKRGLFMPDNFIPLAEESGLIIPLGQWVLREVCTQARAWQEEGIALVKVAVNLSVKQFRQPDLIEQIQTILLQTGLAPTALELELTESVLVHDPTHATQILNRLKELGISLSLDDFGIGYSSLNYLRHFPLNSIKIDRSFIKDMAQNTNGAALSKSIITIAHSLGLKAIAEGVETWEQHDFLASCGCDELQGFLFSKPLTPDEFATLLREKHCLVQPARVSKYVSSRVATPCSKRGQALSNFK